MNSFPKIIGGVAIECILQYYITIFRSKFQYFLYYFYKKLSYRRFGVLFSETFLLICTCIALITKWLFRKSKSAISKKLLKYIDKWSIGVYIYIKIKFTINDGGISLWKK